MPQQMLVEPDLHWLKFPVSIRQIGYFLFPIEAHLSEQLKFPASDHQMMQRLEQLMLLIEAHHLELLPFPTEAH
jgi:hypothetical protein